MATERSTTTNTQDNAQTLDKADLKATVNQPGTGAESVINVQSGEAYVLDFSADAVADAYVDGANLIVEFVNGGKLVLQNYETATEFKFANGKTVAPANVTAFLNMEITPSEDQLAAPKQESAENLKLAEANPGEQEVSEEVQNLTEMENPLETVMQQVEEELQEIEQAANAEDVAEQVAQIEPAAGENNTAGNTQNTGLGFGSTFEAQGVIAIDDVGPIDPTALRYGIPEVSTELFLFSNLDDDSDPVFPPVVNVDLPDDPDDTTTGGPSATVKKAEVLEDHEITVNFTATLDVEAGPDQVMTVYVEGVDLTKLVDLTGTTGNYIGLTNGPNGETWERVPGTPDNDASFRLVLQQGANYDGSMTFDPIADSDLDITSIRVYAQATNVFTQDTASSNNEYFNVIVDAVADHARVDAEGDSGDEGETLDITFHEVLTGEEFNNGGIGTDDGSEEIVSIIIELASGDDLSNFTFRDKNGNPLDTTGNRLVFTDRADLEGLTVTPNDPGYEGTLQLVVTLNTSETPISDRDFRSDNDTSTATDEITLTWNDSEVPAPAPAILNVQEQDLPVDTDTKTLTIDTGTDALVSVTPGSPNITFTGTADGTTLTSNGQPVTVTVEGNKYVGKVGTTTVFELEITLTNGTATATFTLLEPLDHAGSNIDLNFEYTATDDDGDATTGTITVKVLDDVPVAMNDFSAAEEGQTIAGNVTHNDNFSEDEPHTVTKVTFKGTEYTVPSTGSVTITGDYGTFTMDKDGNWTYVANTNKPDGHDVFTYTLVDFDGDESTADLDINVTPDGAIVSAQQESTVDETDLVLGPDVVEGSLEADFGVTGINDVTASGQTNVSGSLTALTHKGTAIVITATTDGYVGMAGTTEVFRLVVQDNGNYTFTLLETLDHAGTQDPNDNIKIEFGFDLKDGTGNPGDGTITINILDDGPVAFNDYSGAEEGQLIAGNVTNNDTLSQDDPNTVTKVTFKGTDYTVPSTGSVSITGDYGTFTMDKNGNWTYQAAASGNPDGSDLFTYTLKDSDGDTDTAELNIRVSPDGEPIAVQQESTVDETDLNTGSDTVQGSLEINGTGGTTTLVTPNNQTNATGSLTDLTHKGVAVVITATAGGYVGMAGTTKVFELTVQDNGNYTFTLLETLDHAGTQDPNDNIKLHFGFDVVNGDGDEGQALITINVLDDGPVALDDFSGAEEDQFISGNVTNNDTLSQDDPNIVTKVVFKGTEYTVPSTGSVTITGDYGTFTMDKDGNWTYQATADNPDGNEIFTYTLKDSDGDTDTAQLDIRVSPDGEPVSVQKEFTVDETDLVPGPEFVEGSIQIDYGLDGAGSVTPSGNYTATATTPVSLTHKGVPVVITATANGYIGMAGGAQIFELTVQNNGDYTFTLNETLDHPGDQDPNDNIRIEFGFTITDADGDTANAEIIINILDDAPVAFDDFSGAEEDQFISGNVTNNDTLSQDDPNIVTKVTFKGTEYTVPSTGSVSITGDYGTFTMAQDGTWTYQATAEDPDGNELFTYTLKDSDGDEDTAELNIRVTEDGEPVSVQHELTVDETDLVPGPEFVSGTVNVDFGTDGPGTISPNDTFTFTPASLNTTGLTHKGIPVVITATANGYVATAGTTTIFELTIQNNGDYTFELFETLDHPGTQDPNDNIKIDFGFTVTDSDGDTANGLISVNILDDGPVAYDDFSGAEEDQLISGNVTHNDTLSQDDPNTVTKVTFKGVDYTVPSTGSVSITGDYGTFTMDKNGNWTYQATADNPDGNELFTYTLKDSEGDEDTAQLNIRVTPDGEPVPVEQEFTVDETNLVPGPEFVEGHLNVNFGANGPGTITPSGNTDATGSLTNLTHKGVPVVITATTNGYIGMAGATQIFELVMQNNGDYTFTLLETLDHAGTQDPNDNIKLHFGFIITDSDGDQANAQITVNVLDDGPVAFDDFSGAEEDQLISGNVTHNDTLSQDDPNTVTKVTFKGVDYTVPSTGSVSITGDYGTFTMDKNGNWTYQATADNPDGNEIFTYTLKDSDGDTDTAELNIRVTPDGEPVSVQKEFTVDETDLANPPELVQGNVNVDFGTDGPGTLTPNGDTSATGSLTSLTHEGTPVIITATANGYVGMAGTLKVFELSVQNNGDYTFQLFETLDHAGTLDPNDNIKLHFGFTVTDADGDTANGIITVNVLDDGPVALDDFNIVDNGNSTSGNVITGAGQIGGQTADILSQDDIDSNESGLQNHVTQIKFGNTIVDVPTTGTATIDGDFGTLEIAADGSYTYTLHNNTGNNQPKTFTEETEDFPIVQEGQEISNNIRQENLGIAVDALEADTDSTGTVNLVQGLGYAGYNNSLGMFSIDANGKLVSGQMLIQNANNPGNTDFNFSLEAGHTAGFFLVADGFDTNNSYNGIDFSNGTLKFVYDDGVNPPRDAFVTDNGNYVSLVFVDNGGQETVLQGPVYYTSERGDAAPLNGDSTVRIVSGFAEGDQQTLRIGFEDLPINESDEDYEDVIFDVTLTPKDCGCHNGGQDQFEYVLTDGDGDKDTAVLTIDCIRDDVPEITRVTHGTVDETSLKSPADVTTSGVVEADFFADGPGTYKGLTGGYHQDGLTSRGETIQVSFNDATNTYTGTAHGDTIFTLTLNETTGQYVFELLDTIDHPVTGNTAGSAGHDDALVARFDVLAIDSDGDSAQTTINITIRDDGPDAVNDGPVTVSDVNTPVTGNVLTNDNLSADTVSDTVNNTLQVFNPATSSYVTASTAGTVIQGTYGKLTIKADGSYSYKLDSHATGTDTFTYKLIDRDGDSDTATISFNASDDRPELATPAPLIVDETHMNPTDEDSDRASADFGNDGPGEFYATGANTFSFGGSAKNGQLTSNGETVNVTLNGNTYTGTAGGREIFTLTIESDGDYEFILKDQLDHHNVTNPDDIIDLYFGITAEDSDGDTATGQIHVQVKDDGPQAFNDKFCVDIPEEPNGPPVALKDQYKLYELDARQNNVSSDLKTFNNAKVFIGNQWHTISQLVVEGGATVHQDTGSDTQGFWYKLPVLVNDSDPDNDDLTITGISNVQGLPSNSEIIIAPDGKSLLIRVGQDLNLNNSSVTLNYTITDGNGHHATAQVCIDICDFNSPLVMDLDGDGIELLAANNGVMFDMDNDGDKELTGWVASDDGLLVLDKNSNGTIDNQSELFGNTNPFTDGFDNLASYDSNNDGVINNQDAIFGDLKVWRDLNSDGISQSGELFSLNTLGINSISLNTSNVSIERQGSLITHTATFTMNGAARDIVDAWFQTGSNAGNNHSQPAEPLSGYVVSGNVITNDDIAPDDVGADAPGTITNIRFDGVDYPIPTGGSVAINGEHGYLVISASGDFIYNAFTGNTQQVSDFFTYTLTDADGDSATAQLEICVEPMPVDHQPIFNDPAIQTVDETFITDTTGDSLFANFGNDGPGDFYATGANTFSFSGSAKNGQLTSNGVAVVVTLVNNTYIGKAGNVTVFELEIMNGTGSNGSYEFRLLDTLDHANASDPNDIINLNFGVTAEDSDGDTDTATITVRVKDDAPIANDDIKTNPVLDDINDTLSGNILTNDTLSKDVVNTIKVGNTTVTTNGVTIQGQYGDLFIKADGTYTYTLKRHGSGYETFTYTLTDFDGDSDDAIIKFRVDCPQTPPLIVHDFASTLWGYGESTSANMFSNDGPNGNGTNLNPGTRIESIRYNGTTYTISQGGSRTITIPNGSVRFESDGDFTFTMTNAKTPGSSSRYDTFEVTIVDSYGNSETMTYTTSQLPYSDLADDNNWGINGTAVTDIIHGLDGNDVIKGMGGNDYLVGDQAHTNTGGNDRIEGGSGDDYIQGYHGSDTLYGDDGNDILIGDANDPNMPTNLYLGAQPLQPTVYNDNSVSGTGNYSGNDTLYGGNGHDYLFGGNGNDTLYGDGGNDILIGGNGTDTLYGGSGADTFTFRSLTEGADTVKDFNIGQGDKLDISDILSGYNAATDDIADFLFTTQNGGNTRVYVDANGSGNIGSATLIATFESVNLTVNDLENNNSIIA